MSKRSQPDNAGARNGASGADWTTGYLKALAETGHCKRSAECAGIDYSTVWRRRQNEPEFEALYQHALKEASQLLEAEAVRRALEGLRRMKFNAKTGEPYIDPETGKPYVEHEYSDTLLLALLKAKFPEQYKDKVALEHSGGTSSTLTVISDQRRAELRAKKQQAIAHRKQTPVLSTNGNGKNGHN